VAITWPGMIALEIKDRVPTLSFKSFGAFIAGAAERAGLVGDTGASDPKNWIGAFTAGGGHVMVTLHAISPEAMTNLQRTIVRVVCGRERFSRDLDARTAWP